jgi:hypothetical protein
MAAHKGHKKAGGRKKGTPNKATASVKQALTEAFEGLGGVPALIEWGKDNKAAFYPLWVRIAPQEHDITSNGKTLEALVSTSRRDE